MTYAVNIGDATRDAFMVGMLLGPVTPSKRIVKAEPKCLDGGAIALECDEKQAKAIVAVIRMKWQKHQLRCYESKTGKGGWRRL